MWFQKKTSLVQAISIQAEKKGFVQYIHTTALPEFRGGRYGFANELQKIFLFADAEHDQKEIAACFLDKIQAFTMRELLRFAEATRCFYAEEYNYASNWQAWRDALRNVRHKREDFSFLSDQEYVAMLCMGTLHSNGYYRQMCIEALRDCGSGMGLYSERYGIGLSLLIFYLLRVNDWVEEVRESAFAAALAEMEQAEETRKRLMTTSPCGLDPGGENLLPLRLVDLEMLSSPEVLKDRAALHIKRNCDSHLFLP